jgi:hypothetical protein
LPVAVLLAAKTPLGANCSNMQIRSALEFLKGRADISCGLNRPTDLKTLETFLHDRNSLAVSVSAPSDLHREAG